MVPSGWKEVKLGDVITHQKGYAFKSTHYCPEGKRIIRISDTDRTSVHDKAPVYINHENALGLERYTLSAGDIILSTVGSRPHLLDSMVGKAVQIPSKDDGALLNQNLVKISPRKNLITNSYLYSMLKKNKFNFFISTLVRGNANQVSITLNELFSYKFLLPSYEEQQKIAEILSTWDKAITTTEQLLVNSQQQKKALMQQLLTGKKRLKGYSTKDFVSNSGFAERRIGEIPSDWKIENINKDLWFQEGPGVRTHQFTESGIKLFNGTNIQKNIVSLKNTTNYISEEEAFGAYKHFLADDGDLVIACSGISVDKFDEKIGFLKKEHLPLCMNTSTMRFKVKENGLVDINYFFYFMQTMIFKNQIRRQATGSAQLNFGPSHIKKCFLMLPSLEEQQKIAAVLTAADAEIETLKQKLDHLKQEKKALMQQLLTGKRRVEV